MAALWPDLGPKAHLLLQHLFALTPNEPLPNRKPIPAAVWRHFVFDKNLIHASLSSAFVPRKSSRKQEQEHLDRQRSYKSCRHLRVQQQKLQQQIQACFT